MNPSTKPPQLPRLTDHPPYVEARKALNDFNDALFKVRSRIAEISIVRSAPEVRPDDAGVTDALAFASTGKVLRPLGEVHAMDEELATLRQHEKALNAAISRQSDALSGIESGFRVETIRRLVPAHKDIARRYLAKLVELDALVDEESALMRQVDAAGIDARFPEPIEWPQLGRLADNTGSMLFYRARDLREYLA